MRRLLVFVSATVLLESTFFAVLAPLLPYYEDEFGLSTSALGALSAVYSAGALAGAIPSGLLAVRVGVKPTVLGGLVIIVATSVAFGLADSVWVLYAARFGQGVGSALAWTGGLAWLIAAAPRERRGELIGIAMGAALAGALLGPVLGGAASLTGPAPAFAAVAAVGVGLAAWALTIPAFPPAAGPQPLGVLREAARVREVVSGFWLVSLAAFLLGVISVVAPVRAGLVAAIAVSVVIPWVDVRWPYLLLVVAAGVAYGVNWVPGTALLSDGAEAAGIDQGFGFALLSVAWAPANVVGAGFGGALADAFGDAAAYLLAAALCLLTLVAVQRRAVAPPAPAEEG